MDGPIRGWVRRGVEAKFYVMVIPITWSGKEKHHAHSYGITLLMWCYSSSAWEFPLFSGIWKRLLFSRSGWTVGSFIVESLPPEQLTSRGRGASSELADAVCQELG